MRLFVAGEIPEAVRAALSAVRERLGGEGAGGRRSPVRWVRPDGLHVTLRFLGETGTDAVPRLTEAIAAGVARFAPVSLSLGGLGCFPPSGPARVLWAGLTGESERLGELARAIEAAVESCGFPSEQRPFRGHVTLARIEDRGAGAALRRRLASEAEGERLLEPPVPNVFPLEEVVLFESRLGAGGSRYTALDRLPLKGRA